MGAAEMRPELQKLTWRSRATLAARVVAVTVAVDAAPAARAGA
jgi:hypothetical protein